MITARGKQTIIPLVPRHQRGLSMVELMIAVVISVVLLGGVITLFITSKRGYAVQDAVGKLQENSRIATGWIDQGLRMTDYWGGTGSSTNLSLSAKVGAMYSSTTCAGLVADSSTGITSGIVGYAGQAAFSSLPTAIQDCIGSSSNYVPNTEVLLVRYADPEPSDLVADADLGSTSKTSTVENDTNANSVFVRYAPGFSSWVFEGNEYAGSNPASLAPSTTNPVFNAPYIVQLFFIAPCSNMANGSTCASTDDSGNPQPALWRATLQGTTPANPMVRQPLVPGVEMLRCRYGVDSTGSNNVDSFYTAANVPSWSQVYVVRYSIVVRADAPDKNQKDTVTYNLADGNTFTASTSAVSPGSVPDYWYIRKVFTESIQIRNRARY